ncbi:MAG: MATE family efflux transporter [Clostridia bacterium]|nr:MATE family efflux transporter [Clostridia bacterium]
MNKNSPTFTEGPLFPNIVKFTIPIILTSILQLLFNTADLIVVGRFGENGSLSVGAVGATSVITNLIINLFIGLSIGAGVSIAHAYGRRDDKALHRIVHTVIPTAIFVGLLLTVVGITIAEPMLRLVNTPEDILPHSAIYMKIYFAGMTFNMVYNFTASMLRAAGDSKSPLVYLTVAGVLNVLLNLLFVIVFHMDVAGVALATTISQGVSAVLMLVVLMRRTDGCKLILSKMRIYKPQLTKIMGIGIPAGIQGSIFSFSTTIIQSSINSFGPEALSGSSAAANIESYVYMCLYAFNQSAVTFIGQNQGAKKYDRVRRSLWICLGCVTVVGIVGGALVNLFAPQLLSLFNISPSNTAAFSHALVRLACISLPYFLCGVMDVTTGALRGMGSSAVPMAISIIGICALRVIWNFTVFKAYPTPTCLYLSFPVTWIVTFTCQFVAFFIVYRMHRKADSLLSNTEA